MLLVLLLLLRMYKSVPREEKCWNSEEEELELELELEEEEAGDIGDVMIPGSDVYIWAQFDRDKYY